MRESQGWDYNPREIKKLLEILKMNYQQETYKKY